MGGGATTASAVERWVQHQPLVAGLAVGLLVAAVAVFLRGLWPAFSPAWPLVVLMVAGFRRPLLFQTVVLIPAALVVAFYCRIPAVALLLPCGVALGVANALVASETAGRWSIEHGGFALVAFAAAAFAGLFCEPIWGMLVRMAHTLGVLVVVIFVVMLTSVVTALRGGRAAGGEGFGTVARRLP